MGELAGGGSASLAVGSGDRCGLDRDRMAKVVQITYTRLDSLSLGDF